MLVRIYGVSRSLGFEGCWLYALKACWFFKQTVNPEPQPYPLKGVGTCSSSIGLLWMVLHNTGVIIAYTVVGVPCYEYSTPPGPNPILILTLRLPPQLAGDQHGDRM